MDLWVPIAKVVINLLLLIGISIYIGFIGYALFLPLLWTAVGLGVWIGLRKERNRR